MIGSDGRLYELVYTMLWQLSDTSDNPLGEFRVTPQMRGEDYDLALNYLLITPFTEEGDFKQHWLQ